MVTVIRWTVVALLVVHGLIHLLGATKGLGWARVEQLKQPIGTTAGVGWLVAAALVLTAAVMIAAGAPTWWWLVVLGAAAVSQLVIVTSWSDAKVGTLPNVVLVLVAVLGFASLGPTSLHAAYADRADELLATIPANQRIVSGSDLAALPGPVATYVRRSGAIGKPRVTGFYATVRGRIRSGPDTAWMPFSGHQLDVFGPEPQRLFYINATRSGLPITVFHDYDANTATMRGRVAGLVQVIDASGPEMDQGETVTVFNDLVVFAPAALIDAPIAWEPIDDAHVRATYTVGDQTVTAELVFNDAGDLVDFVSQDRFQSSEDGKSFASMPWSTPLQRYREIRHRRLATTGEGLWHAPDGTFAYIDFSVDDITYNPVGLPGA